MKPTKMLIPQYAENEVTIRCKHGRLWPPPLVTLDVDIQTMWAGGRFLNTTTSRSRRGNASVV